MRRRNCVGLTILFFGGWQWLAVLLVFFVSAAFFTRFKSELKRRMGTGEEARYEELAERDGKRSVASAFAVAYGLTYFTLLCWAILRHRNVCCGHSGNRDRPS